MCHPFFAGLALALVLSFHRSASAGELEGGGLAFLTHVSSDAFTHMACDLSLGVSEANEILGLEYDCRGDRTFKKFFGIQDIRRGAVLFHYDPLNLDVITLSGANLDSVHGGPVTLRYLSNGLTGDFKNWDASIEPQGQKWVAYTGRSAGHHAFNDLFAVKRTVFGQLVGIEEIRATWR